MKTVSDLFIGSLILLGLVLALIALAVFAQHCGLRVLVQGEDPPGQLPADEEWLAEMRPARIEPHHETGPAPAPRGERW